jgi:hypothetical protein
MKDEDPDPWFAEADAMEIRANDFDVADSAELPAELSPHALAAELDPDFCPEFNEWLEWLAEDATVLLTLEQCSAEGVLLPWDMRGARLQTAPQQAIDRLHWFWDHCPKHLYVYLSHYVFWLVRAERARRRGTPDWSPRSALPPPIEEERAFFRPSLLVTRPYGR